MSPRFDRGKTGLRMDRQRILIVEDSPTMRQLLVFALRRLKDVDIVEAEDGMDGLRKVSGDHFDLALFDINMPVMSAPAPSAARPRRPRARRGG